MKWAWLYEWWKPVHSPCGGGRADYLPAEYAWGLKVSHWLHCAAGDLQWWKVSAVSLCGGDEQESCCCFGFPSQVSHYCVLLCITAAHLLLLLSYFHSLRSLSMFTLYQRCHLWVFKMPKLLWKYLIADIIEINRNLCTCMIVATFVKQKSTNFGWRGCLEWGGRESQ